MTTNTPTEDLEVIAGAWRALRLGMSALLVVGLILSAFCLVADTDVLGFQAGRAAGAYTGKGRNGWDTRRTRYGSSGRK